MDNYKFTSLLEATPLSAEDKHNLSTIFHGLSDTRKQDIMDHWDEYAERIKEIHAKGEDEKKLLITNTFQHINKLIDEAYLRENERKSKRAEAEKLRNQDILASMQYEQERRLEMMKKLSEKEAKARATLDDPLSYI